MKRRYRKWQRRTIALKARVQEGEPSLYSNLESLVNESAR
jgi:hypothetical protein